MKIPSPAKKYLRAVRRQLACGHREKRRYIADLKLAVFPYMLLHPDATAEELCSRFGSPQGIADSFLSTADPSDLAKLHFQKRRLLLACAALFLVLAVGSSIVIQANDRRIPKEDAMTISGSIPLSSLPSASLETLFNELQYVPTNTQTAEDQKWSTVNGIGELLDSRIEESGVAEPKTPVTKALLTDFINDAIWDCRLRLGAAENADPSYIDEDAVMTVAEGKATAQAQLDALTAFLEDVEQNATEDNAPAYWVQYWTEVLELPIPQGYAY